MNTPLQKQPESGDRQRLNFRYFNILENKVTESLAWLKEKDLVEEELIFHLISNQHILSAIKDYAITKDNIDSIVAWINKYKLKLFVNRNILSEKSINLIISSKISIVFNEFQYEDNLDGSRRFEIDFEVIDVLIDDKLIGKIISTDGTAPLNCEFPVEEVIRVLKSSRG